MLKRKTISNRSTVRIPADWEPHTCCCMAWAVHREWGKAVNKVKRELSEVIRTIARYEPVRLLAPSGPQFREAQREFSNCSEIVVIEAPVDDIWMRDIAPTFAIRGSDRELEVVAIDWNFNGWGGTSDRPPRAGDRLAEKATPVFGVPRLSTGIVAEGGAFVSDGRGVMITTRSCLLNQNRSPVRRRNNRQKMIEAELINLGIRRVVWLEGDPCERITSGHADGYVLCAPKGLILVEGCDDKKNEYPMWREHDIALLENATTENGRPFRVMRVRPPRQRYWKGDAETFAAAYLNVYVANGAVIGAKFGDPSRDAAARRALARAFPKRKIIMLRIDAIASGGGGIRCLTQSMPDIRVEYGGASHNEIAGKRLQECSKL